MSTPQSPPARTVPWGVVAVLLMIVVTAIAAGTVPPAPAGAAAGPDPAAPVVYEVDGDAATSDVTWSEGAGAPRHAPAAELPWRREVRLPGGGDAPSLTARNTGGGSVTCRIVLDGVLVAQLTSFDPFGVVACVPDLR